MVTCNHGYNLDKEAEANLDEKPEALRLGLAQIQSPKTTVSPQNPANPGKVLMSCWTKQLRSHLAPTPVKGLDSQGHAPCCHKVKYQRKPLNTG